RYVANAAARPTVHLDELRDLTGAMRVGDVQALLVLGGNPVYTAPVDVPFAAALENVPFTAHLGGYVDETARSCTWHVPEAHFLETWGDARAYDGTITIQQPLILPFYGGKSATEMVSALLGDGAANAYDLVRSHWQARVTGSFDDFWRETVYRGVVARSASAEVTVGPAAVAGPLPQASDVERRLALDPSVLDGRFANNGWLQELPKAFSNLTWDNAALVAPATAEALGVSNGDVISLEANGASVDAPVWVQPGQAVGA